MYVRAKAQILIVALVMLAMALGGCTTLVGETSTQKWFGAKSDYMLVLRTSADYCSSPEARPHACRVMAGIDTKAQALLARGNEALERGGGADLVLALTHELLTLVIEMRAAMPTEGDDR